MNAQIYNGEPAFPLNELNQVTGDVCAQHFGMTLRDYFAAHAPALPAKVREAFTRSLQGDGADLKEHAQVCARWARLYADAMLKELAQ